MKADHNAVFFFDMRVEFVAALDGGNDTIRTQFTNATWLNASVSILLG